MKKSKLLLRTFLLVAILFFGAGSAQAASISISPTSGNYVIGNTISTSVFVSSSDRALNAVSGTLSFPTDKLEVVSLSKSSSIFSLWVQEPTFSNSAGTLNFEGIVLNPGFIGFSGKVITINFKVKSLGVAPVEFSSASILANDGSGTNILENISGGRYTLDSAPTFPRVEPEVTAEGGPTISSPTHPDQDKWYREHAAKFIWSAPAGIDSAKVSIGKNSSGLPTVLYEPAITEKEIADLSDGVWYFNVQLHDESGWGGISRFRARIDSQKPSYFEIEEVSRKDNTEPTARFSVSAGDSGSGIDHYEFQIGEKIVEKWKDDGSHKYQLPPLPPGKYNLIAKAIDGAGNLLANSVDFEIGALEVPKIVEFPTEITSGDNFIVKGTTAYPNSQVMIWIEKVDGKPRAMIVPSDKDENFTFVSDEVFKDGVYYLWAEAVDMRGARSLPTEKLTFLVKKSNLIMFGIWAVNALSIVIPLLALIFLLFVILWYIWQKFMTMKKKLRKEVHEAEDAAHKSFDLLKEEIKEQIKKLEKVKSSRELSEEEEKVIITLRKDLTDAEKFVKKEIKDIEKELN